MGTSIASRAFLDDGGANWGNPEEHWVAIEWHRTSETFTYHKDGERVFHMAIEELHSLIELFRELDLIPRYSDSRQEK